MFIEALAALAVTVAAAENRTGTAGVAAFKIPAGARPAALGGAFVGLADDLNAVTWNPAGLAELHAPEIALLHAQYFVDTTYESIGCGAPLAAGGSLAASLNLLDYGRLPRNLETPNGLFGGQFGSTSPSDLLATAGWGGVVANRVRCGAGVRLGVQQAAGASRVGVGVMVGALWDTPAEGFRLGTVADNLGALMGRGNPLPASWAVGASWAVALADRLGAVWLADTRVAVDALFSAGMGLEVTAFDAVSVRGGWRGGGPLGGPTLGGGVHYPLTWFGRILVFKFDYALATVGELDRVHRFQFGIQFGGVSGTLNLGRIRVVREGGEAVLRWAGKGPAYQVMIRPADAERYLQLTDRPIETPEISLIGLPAGRYLVRIVTVDPYDADWRGAASPDIEIELEGATSK